MRYANKVWIFFSLLLYVQVYKEVSKQTVAYACFSSFLGNCGHFLRAASVQLAFLRDKFFVQEKLIIVHDFEIEVDRICSVQTWTQLLDATILIKLANTLKT